MKATVRLESGTLSATITMHGFVRKPNLNRDGIKHEVVAQATANGIKLDVKANEAFGEYMPSEVAFLKDCARDVMTSRMIKL